MVPTITKKEIDSRRYSESAIFTYSIEHLMKKDKVRFYYALKGRDGKSGIVKRLGIKQLGRAVLLVSSEKKKEVDGFLRYWGCRFECIEVLVKK